MVSYLDQASALLHEEVEPVEINLGLADGGHSSDGRVALLVEGEQSLQEVSSVWLITKLTDLVENLVLARLLLHGNNVGTSVIHNRG